MSIYDSIGGASAVTLAVDDFYARVLSDPELKPYFDGVDMAHLIAHQRAFIGAAIGGPEIFTGRSMREAHARLHVQPDHFDKVVSHLVDTLAGLGVPEPVIAEIGAKLTPLRAEIAPSAADSDHSAA
ncbi:MAG TPA: group 1 truncated hemoglobin [Pseudonocardia sp.]|jgi:hemoglobin|uniref:group I truncated hemoglobin n=1 Tax=Pseudonocardia sp. TaxID=60912 RepID=UPI002F4262E8